MNKKFIGGRKPFRKSQAFSLFILKFVGEILNLGGLGLEADDLVEAMYQGMMRCHLALGCRADALAVFQRLRRTLAAKLRTLPSAESVALAAGAEVITD